MPRNTRALAVIGAILAMELCLGYAGLRATRSAEASRMAVAKKRTALSAEMRALKAAIAARSRERAEAEAVSKESPWRITVKNRNPSNGPKGKPVTAPDPKVAALSLAVFQDSLAQRYRPFYQNLGLSPSQIGAFENLLMEYREEMIDLQAVASAAGLDSGPEIIALRQQENDSLRAEQIVLLGEDGYQQLQQFGRLMPAWNFLTMIEDSTGLPSETLTDTQAQQLVAALANASSSYQNGGPVDSHVDWNAVLSQAQGALSAAQLGGLKTAIDQVELLRLEGQFFQREHGLK